MEIPEFPSVDTVRRLWWLHDSFWHAALVKEVRFERANRINLEVAEFAVIVDKVINGYDKDNIPLFYKIHAMS